MESWTCALTVTSVIFIVRFDLIAAANVVSINGVCEIEVPTVSILPPELKHSAAAIRDNGSNPGLSKIKICCAGYTIASHKPFSCVPFCSDGCGLGSCTAPGVCSCDKNAVKGPDEKCLATCPKSCLNGQCYNKHCNCNLGFILESKGKYCIPGCTRSCGDGGICIGNNQCECEVGYHLNRQGVCVMFCEQGYHQVGNICEPMCPRGCQDGICTAPNVCSCNPGWTLGPSGYACKPSCSPPCLNGECVGPNQCICKPGYLKVPNDIRANRCTAHCPQGCPNGFCSAPNFCICNEGYAKEARGSNVCIKKIKG